MQARVPLTAAAWSVLRRIPGDSTRLGPPRHFAESLPAWAEAHPEVDVQLIDRAQVWDLPLPLPPSSEPPPVFRQMSHRVEMPTWLARIPGGRVVGDQPTVIAQDDTVFGDLFNWWPTSVGNQDIFRRLRLSKAQRIRGTVVVVGAHLANNYYHWLIDIVPRLRLLGDALNRAGHIIVPAQRRFQRECLQAAGVSLDRVIEPVRSLHVVADELLVPALVPRAAKESIEYLHELFGERRADARPTRRLYATRSNVWRRRVKNEDELVATLAPLGFETVVMDGLSVAEQARLFAEAEAVVGPNGSALANIAFAPPGVVLVELFDSNYTIMGDWELTVRVGGNYHMFISPSSPARTQWRDIVAPISDIRSALGRHGIM